MKKLFTDSIGSVVLTRMPEDRLKEEKNAAGGWTAPVWRLGVMNLNGRIYPEELADKLIAEGKTTVAYDGHNVDAIQEYEAVKAIVKNPRKEINSAGIVEMWVDIIIIDEEYEKLLEKILGYGIPIGVSSVGWGETDANGRVVAATYELVRYLDFVLNPAGEVYAEPKKEDAPDGKGDDKNKTEGSAEPKATPEVSEDLRAAIVLEVRKNQMLKSKGI